MNNDLKTIFYIGLGLLSDASENALLLRDEFLKKGKELYDKGIVKNEELKHNVKEKIKKNVTIINIKNRVNFEDYMENIDNLTLVERKKLMSALNKKGWTDDNEGQGDKKSK